MSTRRRLEEALAHHQAGRLAEAAAGYAAVLEQDPGELNAVYLSGVLAHQQGDHATALARIDRAIAAKPDNPDFHNNRGEALRALERQAEAETAYRRALALDPEHAGATANLATLLRARGELGAAIALYRQALAREPGRAAHHNNLAAALTETGDLAAAEAGYRQALALAPDYPEALTGLANVLRLVGRLGEAMELHRRALALAPDDRDALRGAAVTTAAEGRLDDAARLFEACLARAPDDAAALAALAPIEATRGDVRAALALLDRAAASPRLTKPHEASLLGGMALMLRQYASAGDGATLAAAHRAWYAHYAESLRAAWQPHANDRDPGAGQPGHRRLRIGFVSPDFRRHAVATFFAPLAEALAEGRECLEIVCYSDVVVPDAVTARVRAAAALWRPILGMPDEAAAAQVRADAIDILVDLAGHTGDNRMLLFARKPAPVQASWLGYPGTTGNAAIDWRFSDAACDPPADDRLSTERVMRLPGFLCYEPPGEAPAVAPLPMLANGAPTVGSFNNLMKLSDGCARMLAAVLAAAPRARLALKGSGRVDDATRQRHRDRIAAHGIDPARIVMLPHDAATAEHLGRYAGLDLALDTYPYCGTTTTCEALWMGVPVVTLAGDRHAARVGASLLSQVGLADFVARSEAEYAAIAAGWLRRPDALATLRAGMRARLLASPLLDARALARAMEGAFRAMWRDWAERSPPAA